MVSGLSLDFLVSNVYRVDFSACHAICSTCPQGYMGRLPIHFPHERVSAPYNPVDMRSKSHVILWISRWYFVAPFATSRCRNNHSKQVSMVPLYAPSMGSKSSGVLVVTCFANAWNEGFFWFFLPNPTQQKKFKRCKLVDNLDDIYLCYLACWLKDLKRKAPCLSKEGPLRL